MLTGDSVTETENEILHMYCAMSLPEAHDLQQTVLARVSSLALAAALVKAAVTLFDFRYADESVCSETPELQAEWDDLINEMRVSRGCSGGLGASATGSDCERVEGAQCPGHRGDARLCAWRRAHRICCPNG